MQTIQQDFVWQTCKSAVEIWYEFFYHPFDEAVIRVATSLIDHEKYTVEKRKSDIKHFINEPRHDTTNEMSVRPAKTQISLGIRPV